MAHSQLLKGSLGLRAPKPFSPARPPAQQCRPGRLRAVLVRAAKADSAQKSKYTPTSARDAVETALRLQKETGNMTEAIRLYALAMEMKPNQDEARAALYNMGCALAKQKQWSEATKCVVKSINDYGLKLTVALNDEDLKELRERREWLDGLMEVKGGVSRDMKIDLRTEAKAPFRFPRLIILGGLGIGAAAGLFIITLRLIKALQGGEGAPDLQESLQNFGINLTAVIVLGFLVYRDIQSKQKVVKVTEREEVLGRLQIDLGGDRQLPLLRFRGQVRPVIISGSRRFVEAAIETAKPRYQELRERGVSVIPVILDEVEAARKERAAQSGDPDAKIRALKAQFQKDREVAGVKGFGSKGSEPSSSSSPTAAAGKSEAAEASTSSSNVSPTQSPGIAESDKRWRLKAYDVVEWKEWLDKQREFASLPADARDLYVQVQLDGTVRSSGRGIPDWPKFVSDLPPLDDVRTRFMDGVGTDV